MRINWQTENESRDAKGVKSRVRLKTANWWCGSTGTEWVIGNWVHCPGCCGSVDWALAWEPKGHWFDSWSGHMPAGSPVGGIQQADVSLTHLCFSPCLSSSLPFSLKNGCPPGHVLKATNTNRCFSLTSMFLPLSPSSSLKTKNKIKCEKYIYILKEKKRTWVQDGVAGTARQSILPHPLVAEWQRKRSGFAACHTVASGVKNQN